MLSICVFSFNAILIGAHIFPDITMRCFIAVSRGYWFIFKTFLTKICTFLLPLIFLLRIAKPQDGI
jgi:hypothetical protein